VSPVKRFLLIFFGGAFAAWLTLVLLFGPSGYTSDYMSGVFTFEGREMERKAAHDEYLLIIKSFPYKLYAQRPHLHPPEAERNLEKEMRGEEYITERDVRFVAAYEGQEAFQQEQRRRGLFEFLYRALNVVLIIVLVWRFAVPPMKGWLSAQVAAECTTMEDAARERESAEERLATAQSSVEQLPGEREQLEADTDERIKRELTALEEANEESLALVRQELEDRKKKELLAAAYLVKRELVDESLERLIARLREESAPERQAAWLGQFMTELEHRAS
jgi:F0F1-type ATP synthase membrane subunit b/b'